MTSISDLDVSIPFRFSRIGFCREFLKSQLSSLLLDFHDDDLVIVCDLDSFILQSISINSLSSALSFLDSSHYNAVFPISTPYYYDSLALVPCTDSSPFKSVDLFNPPSSCFELAQLRQTNQLHSSFFSDSAIPVASAFGGIGIYKLNPYLSSSYYPTTICEHITFNSSLHPLCIYPPFIVSAPVEHIFSLTTYGKYLQLFLLTISHLRSSFYSFFK